MKETQQRTLKDREGFENHSHFKKNARTADTSTKAINSGAAATDSNIPTFEQKNLQAMEKELWCKLFKP